MKSTSANLFNLIPIGYWKSTEEPNLPDPTQLPKIDPEIKPIVLQYLANGKTHKHWRGHSWCRFRCGIPNTKMGSTDQTDGKYVWPTGLYHYIEEHNITLPQEFINHIIQNTKRK